jgi:hypothetical protein
MSFPIRPAIREVTVVEATLTDMPENIVDEVRQLWINCEFGNDHYYFRWETIAEIGEYGAETNYPNLYKYMVDNKIEKCLIHYWW